MATGLADNDMQVKSMASHMKRLRQAGGYGLGLSKTAAHWKLQSAEKGQIKKTESVNKAKEQFIKDLQAAAKSDVYSKAWLRELRDYRERNNTMGGLNGILRKIESFNLESSGKAQNIDADYKTMFGSDTLLQIHQNLLKEAHKEIVENKELVYATDWEKLSIVPESQFV